MQETLSRGLGMLLTEKVRGYSICALNSIATLFAQLATTGAPRQLIDIRQAPVLARSTSRVSWKLRVFGNGQHKSVFEPSRYEKSQEMAKTSVRRIERV